MSEKKEKQTKLYTFETKQVGLDIDAYNILSAVKNQLMQKHLRNFTYSDVVRELDKRSKEKIKWMK